MKENNIHHLLIHWSRRTYHHFLNPSRQLLLQWFVGHIWEFLSFTTQTVCVCVSKTCYNLHNMRFEFTTYRFHPQPGQRSVGACVCTLNKYFRSGWVAADVRERDGGEVKPPIKTLSTLLTALSVCSAAQLIQAVNSCVSHFIWAASLSPCQDRQPSGARQVSS